MPQATKNISATVSHAPLKPTARARQAGATPKLTASASESSSRPNGEALCRHRATRPSSRSKTTANRSTMPSKVDLGGPALGDIRHREKDGSGPAGRVRKREHIGDMERPNHREPAGEATSHTWILRDSSAANQLPTPNTRTKPIRRETIRLLPSLMFNARARDGPCGSK